MVKTWPRSAACQTVRTPRFLSRMQTQSFVLRPSCPLPLFDAVYSHVESLPTNDLPRLAFSLSLRKTNFGGGSEVFGWAPSGKPPGNETTNGSTSGSGFFTFTVTTFFPLALLLVDAILMWECPMGGGHECHWCDGKTSPTS